MAIQNKTTMNFKCRCSSISKILSNSRSNPVLTENQVKELCDLEGKVTLTEKQKEKMAELLVKKENGKKVILSDSCIEYLMEWYAFETEGMIPVSKESLDNLTMKKGKMGEPMAVGLLSITDELEYKIHKERIFNDYLSGEVDCYIGEDIYRAINVTDTKISWDYPTFLKKLNTGLENGQEEQLQGYGDITGARELYVANCLVDAPDEIIEDYKWKVARKLNALTTESPEFLIEWAKFEHSMKFSQISLKKRISKIKVEPFSEIKRQQVYDRVKICREWLNNFHEQRQKLN